MQSTRPADLIYALNEKPPFLKLLLLAVQQLFMISIYLILTVVIAHKARVSETVAQNMVSFTFLAMAIATVIQVVWKGPIGSGFLAPACVAPSYLQASMAAVTLGGLPLLSGMLIFSGICESFFAFFTKKLRFLFPRVVTGLIFCFIALSIALVAFQSIFVTSLPLDSKAYLLPLSIYGLTLIAMIIFNVWGKGMLKLLCMMVGLVGGCILGAFFHLFSAKELWQLQQASYIKLPDFSYFHYQFSWTFAPLFIITALVAGLRTIGVLTTCQQINDAKWRRVEPVSIRKGVLADGLAAAICGIFNTPGVGVAASAVGVSKATGATSRYVAFAVAVLCVICALLPKISALFLALPLTVAAAGLTFASCIMLVGGLRIITSQELDARKTIIIGLSLLIALSPAIFPHFFAELPSSVRPIGQSIMMLGTLTAILLNLIFRIGIARQQQFIFTGQQDQSYTMVAATLKKWNIDPDIAENILQTIKNLYCLLAEDHYSSSEVRCFLNYDEVKLTVKLLYQGNLPTLNPKPTLSEDDLVEDNVLFHGLRSLYHRSVLADQIKSQKTDKGAMITLVFEL